MRVCPKCGNMEAESSKFCSVCGGSMTGALRQNPFRSAAEEPPVPVDPEETQILPDFEEDITPVPADPTVPLAYTDADPVQPENTGKSGGKPPKKPRSNRPIIVACIVILLLLIIGATAFAVRVIGGSGNTETPVSSASVDRNSANLDNIFESETPQPTESEVAEESDVAEDPEVVAPEVEAVEETQPVEESEAVVETPAESESPSPEVSESPSPSPEVSESPSPSPEVSESPSPSPSEPASTGKTYNGVAITTDYVISDSATRYLTEGDLSGLNAQQLKIARNEIYARHGRMFNSSDLQAYFNSCSWYSGTVSAANFNEDTLNDYEKENAKFIQAYEAKMGY